MLDCQTLDNGLNIIQLETAVGAGIESFEGAVGTLISVYNILIQYTTRSMAVMADTTRYTALP